VHVSILFLILKTTQGKEEEKEGDMPALEKSNVLVVQVAHTIADKTTKVWRPTLFETVDYATRP
jgi:hypothetical protein